MFIVRWQAHEGLIGIGIIEEDSAKDEDFVCEEFLLARSISASMLDRVVIGEREGELVWRQRVEPPKI